MDKEKTIKEVVEEVERSSTTFEKTNTDLKRKFLKWNIEAFNMLAASVTVNRGSFGTGYPFYVLDENLNGEIPIISEQIRYNRQLVRDGEPVQKSIWQCKSCLERNYEIMPDLKIVCKPCPNMLDSLKPRKLINRLPDLDMWLVCEDGKVEQAQEELFDFLTQAATPANFRRFQEHELEEIFYRRIAGWGGQLTQQRGELEDDGVPEL